MPLFAWDAVDLHGHARRGTRSADSDNALASMLEADGFTVLDVRIEENASTTTAHHGRPSAPLVVEALRSVCVLLRAGLPLDKAIAAASDAADPRCRALLDDIRDTIAHGASVADGFARHPTHFDASAIGLIRSGERSGDLAGALDMLVSMREREIRLRTGLLTAAIYPAILAATSLLAAIAILVFVVPRFAVMIEGAGGELPATTSLLVATSTGLRRIAPVLAVVVPMGIVALATMWRTAAGRERVEQIASAMPLLGELRRAVAAARGARVAGSLMNAGIPLVDALAAAGDALGGSASASAFHRSAIRLREGAGAGSVLGDEPAFPPVLARLARAGNEVGDMATFLIAAADVLDRSVETTTRRIGIILEPLIIVFFGGLIGFVAFALFQAVYGLNAGGLQ
ncbi:MAG: type II secretion system F family protein [Longimicrobiales bacterium]